METPTPVQAEPKKSNTGLLIGIGIVVIGILLVICVLPVIVIAALTIMGPLVGEVFSTINSSLITPSP